jgi:peptide deformylase
MKIITVDSPEYEVLLRKTEEFNRDELPLAQEIADKVPRFEKIQVNYLNRQGEWVEKVLEGFAAKAFQHEYDHLQGIVNIYRPDAVAKSFDSKNELTTFMQVVKKEDATRYKAPNQR